MKKEFWEDYSVDYQRTKENSYQRYLYNMELCFVAGNYMDKSSILDAGCGTGILSHKLLCFFEEVVGCDISKNMLVEAEKNYPILRGRLVNADIYNLPFRDSAFSNTCCFRVLSFLERKKEALEEIFRVTRAGGIVFIDVLSRHSYARLRHPVVNLLGMRESKVTCYHWYSMKELTDEFSSYGTIRKIRGIKSPVLFPHLHRLSPVRMMDDFLSERNILPSRYMIAVEKA